MTTFTKLYPLLQGLNKTDYNVETLDDEIRVDKLCVDILRHLYQDLTQQSKIAPEQAGEFCHGADYFLREFIIADRRVNLFDAMPIHVRQFAGHWYIIRTTEPNLTELKGILSGTAEFYRFLVRQGLITESVAKEIASQCQELDYYQQRIDDFWAIEGDGYNAWRQACPVEPAAE
ncbi:MAG: hypothetical protein KAU27_05910 [Desulfuromonadales bacterium]|nr:hypothetical protein [Desulfuromonadales bacterium]